ncbi:hypothetical protein [Xanthomonas cucurbitae]|uniref:Uncharacterized protein n=1 Tax=Xanthomonas cucurbitae TaxID=56453 RepID=A0ABY7YI78_9XANT|nr:hypothetical protein [Xanthomonas cucurbitae]WDM69587.1 hypothetical protein K6981_10435 [Xanthomonas cucurbitae]WDM73461.1 hypothetical protein K6978_10410 [Xanthomonas cucurbitae]WDM80730.1 hypothetical protein K6980_08820 [Xanthomonas cucurbitae]WDM84425.1 hypothetical protein K6979_08825 [Xanthomonas cucurbitae]
MALLPAFEYQQGVDADVEPLRSSTRVAVVPAAPLRAIVQPTMALLPAFKYQ